MGFISIVFLNLVAAFWVSASSSLPDVIYWFLYFNAFININLAVFNLLPIPPLDGSRLAAVIIPDKYYYKIMQYEKYIMIAVLLLLFTGLLTGPLVFLSTSIFNGMNWLVGLIF